MGENTKFKQCLECDKRISLKSVKAICKRCLEKKKKAETRKNLRTEIRELKKLNAKNSINLRYKNKKPKRKVNPSTFQLKPFSFQAVDDFFTHIIILYRLSNDRCFYNGNTNGELRLVDTTGLQSFFSYDFSYQFESGRKIVIEYHGGQHLQTVEKDRVKALVANKDGYEYHAIWSSWTIEEKLKSIANIFQPKF